MKLFKYLPSDRVDVLENLKIRFTQLSSLNDPHEMFHSVDVVTELDKVLISSINELNDIWDDMSGDDKKKHEKEYRQTLGDIKQFHNELLRSYQMTDEISARLDRTIGVLSLSQTNANLLMWSHYADSGRGYVISFDSTHEFFHKHSLSGKETKPIVVDYVETKPRVNAKSMREGRHILGVKPLDWMYEEEVRITINFIGMKPKVNDHNRAVYDDFGNKIYLIDMPNDVINAVYLGPRVSDRTKKAILNALNDNNIDCPVYQSEFSNEKYQINFDAIKA